jgi:ankyrin repeat protein
VKENLFTFVKFLLDSGADVNIYNKKSKWTPLMYSIQRKHFNITELLLQRGADVNLRDIDNHSPLMLALDSQYIPICKAILKFNPTIDVN